MRCSATAFVGFFMGVSPARKPSVFLDKLQHTGRIARFLSE